MPTFQPLLETLPHRPPFLFVDEIVEIEAKRIATKTYIDPAADFFRGHRPAAVHPRGRVAVHRRRGHRVVAVGTRRSREQEERREGDREQDERARGGGGAHGEQYSEGPRPPPRTAIRAGRGAGQEGPFAPPGRHLSEFEPRESTGGSSPPPVTVG